MLREDYVQYAAAVHIEGARFLRDGAAALLPCCTFAFPYTAFAVERTLTRAESLLAQTVELSAGLLEHSGITKYTSVMEARMRLAGVELDATLTTRQTEAERARSVAPGRRAEIYDGFRGLSARACDYADAFLQTADEIRSRITEGRMAFAVPMPALKFLRLIGADYKAAAAHLAKGEQACLLRRPDAAESYARCLRHAVIAFGGEEAPASADALAARASSGLVPSLPPMLFEILLRYENLPAALCGDA